MPYLGLTAIVVRDYDEAIAFYVDALGFELLQNTHFDDGIRWVVVAPPGGETGLLLARALRRTPLPEWVIRPADVWAGSSTPTTSNATTPG